MIKRAAFLMAVLCGWVGTAAAEGAGPVEFYPSIYPRVRNENLKEQIASDSAGRFPPFAQLDWMTAAVDGHLFYRSYRADTPGYYHGGFWFNFLNELRPTPGITLNARFVIYNPAFSYGAASFTRLHPFFGLTWQNAVTPAPSEAWWRFRAGDLDRQTLGSGLTLEDKEMGGLSLEIGRGAWRFRGLVDGTGGFTHAGDLHYLQLDWSEDLLGLTVMRTGFAQKIYPAVYSKHALGKYLSYAAEASVASASSGATQVATLARLQYQRGWQSGLALRLRAENRNFPTGFAQGYFEGIEGTRAREITGEFFPAEVEHDYLAIDQEDKPYADSPNLFVIGRDVMSTTLLADLQWEILDRFFFVTVNEIAFIRWRGRLNHTTYLYRHGLRLALDQPRSRWLDLFVSNKSTSAQDVLDESDLYNKTSVLDRFYVAIEGRLRF